MVEYIALICLMGNLALIENAPENRPSSLKRSDCGTVLNVPATNFDSMEIIVLYLRGTNDEDLQQPASCSMRTDAYEIYTMQSASHSCCQHIAVKTEETECISRSDVWGRRLPSSKLGPARGLHMLGTDQSCCK